MLLCGSLVQPTTMNITLTRAARLITMWLICLALADGQDSQRAAVLSVFVVNERGDPLQQETHVKITGQDFNYETIVRVRGSIPLPIGNYTIGAWSGSLVSLQKLINVRQSDTQIILSLSPKPMDDDAPWVIRGNVIPPPSSGKTMVARLVPLYLDRIEDSVVQKDGSFRFSVWQISRYKLWILSEGKRLAERDVEVTFQPKELPPIEIRLPQN